MYNHLRGRVVKVVPGRVVLEVGGIGWDIHAPLSTTSKIALDKEVLLMTHLAVREDDISIYGFSTEDERELFRVLIGISGVGAATAIQILSSASVQDFILAIEKQDTNFLKKIKGIGEKTAKRIILELKGAKTNLTETDAAGTALGDLGALATDAVLALEAMGVPQKEGRARVEKVLATEHDLGLEEIIRRSLQG